MANREENIKKINAELEQLNDEQLEQIAGGTYNETAADTRFLNDLAGLCDRFGATKAFFQFGTVSGEAVKGWNQIGISVDTSWGGSNRYFKDGQELTRREAFQYACEKYGKKLQDMPGDYNF